MKGLIVPLLFGAVLGLFGRRYGGGAAGLFMAALGLALGWMLSRTVRGRRLRNAPPAPPLLPGEAALLHGPLTLIEAPGRRRGAWGYLSDRRLSLRPTDGGDGVDLDMARVEEIRPGKRGFLAGEIAVLVGKDLWRLKVPDYKRWLGALRSAARGLDG